MSQSPADAASALWAQALARLEQEAGDTLYQTVFQMGTFKGIEGDRVVIAFPFPYLIRLFGSEELTTLNTLFSELAQRPVRTQLVIEPVGEQRFSRFASEKRDIISQRKEQLLGDAPKAAEPRPARPHSVNEAWSFPEFIVRDTNQLAAAACLAVAGQPGTQYNPLYLYSGTGLGKTHLLHAIGNELWRKNSNAKVAVVNAEDFANEFIEAIRNKNTKGFRDKVASYDALLIDDLHFLMNKPNCQEAFMHAFNTFYDAHKQIVVTADRKPRELATFPERLVSRLEGGLIADLQRPAYESRLAILQAKAKNLGLTIPVESLSTIANLVTTNVRALEGCLKMLRAQMLLRAGQPLGHEELEKLVLDFLSTTDRGSEVLDLNTIMEKLSTHYRVPISELVSKKRTASVAHPRQMVMYFCRQLTNMSLEEIGRAIGGRDHSTVLYACQKIQGRAQVDPTFRREVEFVRSLLTGQRASQGLTHTEPAAAY